MKSVHEVYENINYVISGIPWFTGRMNMRHCNNFYPESLINVPRIYVFKFVTFNYVISGIPRFTGSLQKN